MATLSTDAIKRLQHALGSKAVGNEVATALNLHDAMRSQSAMVIPMVVVATNVSQTIDFAALAVGDLVIMIPATAGNADLIGPIAVAGTLGQAAVVGNIYVAFRPLVAPTAVDQPL